MATGSSRTWWTRLLLITASAVVGCQAPSTEEEALPPTGPGEAEAASTTADTDAPAQWTLDESTALALAAMPLSCLDRPHAPRPDRPGYLDDVSYERREGFESSRAFYGCWDWHSAVNSTWTLVRILKEFPDLPIAPLIREKLRSHLSEEAMAGELEFFQDNATFERPYGYAWLLKLHAELATWRDPEAANWAGNLEALQRLLGTRLVDYAADLDQPVRLGVHSNTAFAAGLALEATKATGNLPWDRILRSSVRRLFESDRSCPTAYEPSASDFVSPCLEEAAVMGSVLDEESYSQWLDGFLPPLASAEAASIRSPAPTSDGGPSGRAVIEDDSVRTALGARSHLIGLAFTRAEAMLKIAGSLPETDPRIEELRRLAQVHGDAGFEAMFDADYAGSHWIGSFALKYLTAR
ncbi:MAG: DUF2891 domain-containing protein [Gemmatimonadota bacterium]|nr:DUF2891 domain-containing protein [Gemmatimonadota bacterium]